MELIILNETFQTLYLVTIFIDLLRVLFVDCLSGLPKRFKIFYRNFWANTVDSDQTDQYVQRCLIELLANSSILFANSSIKHLAIE